MKRLKHKNETLFRSEEDSKHDSRHSPLVSISPNICEEKNVCKKCGRGDRYGIPLVYILRYANKGFETVCYKCGKKAAIKVGLKLPLQEADIFNRIAAEDGNKMRKGWLNQRR